MKQDIDRKIEDTLNSLDGVPRAEASPFLYSKIRNRMQYVQEVVPQRLVWRMVIALTIVAIVNVFTVSSHKQQENRNGAELVANEYSISLPQTY